MSEVENKAVEVKAPVAKIDAAAEKAYAEASAKVAVAPKADAAPVAVKAAPAAKIAAPKKAPAAKKAVPAKKVAAKTVKKTAAKPAAKKPVVVKKALVKKVAAKVAPNKSKPAAAAPASTNPVIKLKDTIMATAKNTDITATAKDMLADVQTRAKTAFAKTSELTAEAGEFTKANVEAVVESGKIFFTGAQELLKDNVETGKTVIETVTEDAKKVAAVKSPTELMQLQGEIARRNFDAVVAYGSKRTEAWVKLTNEAFAPISNRVSVAAEKISKAA
ncbi:MAG: phasin family protein [Rhizobiales bacterium]|nr:phasin family protein [Hyphomicrobiales bacterium]